MCVGTKRNWTQATSVATGHWFLPAKCPCPRVALMHLDPKLSRENRTKPKAYAKHQDRRKGKAEAKRKRTLKLKATRKQKSKLRYQTRS